MLSHRDTIGYSLGTGVAGFIVFFAVGSHSRSGTLGMVALALFVLATAVWFVRLNPKAVWYAPALLNLPTWAIFIGPADPGQFPHYLKGLVACVVAAYAGALIGARLRRTKPPPD
jgi:hypothetical protein